jgi:alpha-L-fucosidase 2
MFDTHPIPGGMIFQIDGNFGATAGMAEMLLQSHAQEIAFIPALPKDWASGSVKGLRTRGGLEVDIIWQESAAPKAEVRALRSGEHRFRAPAGYQISQVKTHAGTPVKASTAAGADPTTRTVAMSAGTSYAFEFTKL